ncbi:MAG: hypothetical protein AB1345_11210 [Chloroflexota bacterium]
MGSQHQESSNEVQGIMSLDDMVNYQDGAVVSRTILKKGYWHSYPLCF